MGRERGERERDCSRTEGERVVREEKAAAQRGNKFPAKRGILSEAGWKPGLEQERDKGSRV